MTRGLGMVDERFWAKTRVEGNCWIWTGRLQPGGYGLVSRTIEGKRRSFLAHRYSYQIAKGEIPAGLLVRHSCDVRRCVNPDHLDVGTHAQNSRDAVERGRLAQKLCADDVRVIRFMEDGGVSRSEIAAVFGISQSMVSNIIGGKFWAHVPLLDAPDPIDSEGH